MTESRVEACIDSVMASHPSVSALAQSKYFEAVHQELAPLARKMEIELGLAKVELERTRNGAKIMELTLEAAATKITQLRQALKDCQTVAIMRGDKYLCDCIDNTGQRYQSAHLAALLEKS